MLCGMAFQESKEEKIRSRLEVAYMCWQLLASKLPQEKYCYG